MARAIPLVLGFALLFWNLGALERAKAETSHKGHGVHSDRLLSATQGPLERRDIEDRLRTLFCDEKNLQPEMFWRRGIFDGQVEGRYLESKDFSSDELLEAAQNKAKYLARINKHFGYAFGVCEGQAKAWAAAVPAPRALDWVQNRKTLRLPLPAIRKSCSSWSVDYAQAVGGGAQQLKEDTSGEISTKSLKRGVVSVTCQPRTPRWAGPVLWYLYPVAGFPEKSPPFAHELIGDDISTALVRWIEKIRQSENLKPIIFNSILAKYADLLAIDGSLKHNRSQQAYVASKLKDHNLSPIGEDRVRGDDAKAMAWLLWNSPRHRGLILNSEATLIGIGINGQGSERLAVILTGKDASPPLVQKSDSKLKKSF